MKLYNADMFEVLPKIQDNSIHMIFADFPYGNTANIWDKRIDEIAAFDHFRRIITKTGVIICTATFVFATELYKIAKDIFKYDLVWDKKFAGNFINAPYQPLKTHEQILVFSKASGTYVKTGITMTYNPQMIKRDTPIKTGKINIPEHMHSSGNQTKKIYDEKYPTSILHFAKEQGKAKISTQKSIDMLVWLINTYSNNGDTVLDPVMGSGSTGVASLLTGRKFIGIEKYQKHFDIAKDWIKQYET